MSEPAVRAELQITLKDGATAGLKAVTQAAVTASEKTASATVAAANRTASAQEKLASAHAALGVRSEQAIQNEIKQTQRAYAALSAAGFSSAEAQARAYEKTREKI